jgi:hypothetical protein
VGDLKLAKAASIRRAFLIILLNIPIITKVIKDIYISELKEIFMYYYIIQNFYFYKRVILIYNILLILIL